MKNILYFLTMVPVLLIGQYDFNTWKNNTQLPTYASLEPQGWTTTNAIFPFAGSGISKSDESPDQSSSCKLKTQSVFNQLKPAGITLGNAFIDYKNLDFISKTGGLAINGNLITFRIIYKLQSPLSKKAEVTLIVANDETSTTKFTKIITLDPATEWTTITTDITFPQYTSGDRLYVTINSPAGDIDGELFVDDVDIQETPSSNNDISSSKIPLTLSRNVVSSGHEVIIENSQSQSLKLFLITNNGQNIKNMICAPGQSILNTDGLIPGLYLLTDMNNISFKILVI
ncbi:MAG: hypothetical protein KA270_01775 [Saprospiraceae bacterium]|nr:hypothetical protein [Saprospiraceae bacterium]MBP6565862.1 hypothetical protein [Saprospiraceae bacterium]